MSAAPATITVTKINATEIEFSDPRKNKNGGVSIGIKYNKQNVQFRLPQIAFPGGLQIKENMNKDGSVTLSYTLAGSMNGGDPYGKEISSDSSETAKLYNFMHDLEEHIIKTAVANSGKWFGKVRSEAGVRETFNKFVSVSVDKIDGLWVPNGKYPPSLRMKLPVYDGKVCMEAIDTEDNDVPLTTDNLTTVFSKGSSAKMIMQASIYITGQGFGVTWKPTYAEVHQRKRQTARDFFKRDEDDCEATADDEDDEVVDYVAAPAAAAPAPITAPTAAPDSSEVKPARRRKVA